MRTLYTTIFCLIASFSITSGQTYTFETFAGPPSSPGLADGAGVNARFNNPNGIAADQAGNLYVADRDNHAIRRITPDGLVSKLAGGRPGSQLVDGSGDEVRFAHPAGLAVDNMGNVYVTESWGDSIRKITPEGVVTTVAGQPGMTGSNDGPVSGPDAALFHEPRDVAVETFNHAIRRISPDGNVTQISGDGELARIGWHGDGVGWFGRFNAPQGIAVDNAGNPYVADTGNHVIRKGVPKSRLVNLSVRVSQVWMTTR